MEKNIDLRKKYNRAKRNASTEEEKRRYEELYTKQKIHTGQLIKNGKEENEIKITNEIRNDRNSNTNLWKNTNKLRGLELKNQVQVYSEDGVALEKQDLARETSSFWKKIYQKSSNNIPEVWNNEKKIEYTNKIEESARDKPIRIIYGKEEDIITIPNHLLEHYDALSGEIAAISGSEMQIDFRGTLDSERIQPVLMEHFDATCCRIDVKSASRQGKHKMKPVAVNEKEMKEELQKLKNNKQPGPDNIKNEMFRWLKDREVCTRALVIAMNNTINEKKIPESWKYSKTVLIPKKTKPKVSEFRPIALTNVGYKIFMSVLKRKIVEHLTLNEDINEFQSGFTKGRRTEDNVLILSYCVGDSKNRKKIFVLGAVDFKKAFDSVFRKAMIESLKEREVEPNTIELIARLYMDDQTMIYLNGEKLCDVNITTGIRQGCTGSPQLFIMVLNAIIKQLNMTKIGFRNEKFYIPALFFADDGLLMTNSIKGMEQLLGVMQRVALKAGLEVNKDKSFCMVFNSKNQKPDEIDNIKVVESIKYLGVTINDSTE